jgi:hypothetical protein
MLSAKRFRKFAYDKNDDLSSGLINREDYQKAKPILNRVHSCLDVSTPITVIILQSEKQKKLLNDINQIVRDRDTKLMRDYPEIKWESEFNAEIKRSCIEESLNDKYKHLGLGLRTLFLTEGDIIRLKEKELSNGNIT